MATTRIFIDDREWRKLIKTMNKNVKKPAKIMEVAFLTVGFRDIIDHFDEERGPGGPWIKSQRAIRQNGQTLQDRGKLKGGFLTSNIQKKKKNEILFFNSAQENGEFYGGTHDRGDPSRNIPQREFMYLSRKAQENMVNLIADLVIKK